MTTAPVDETAEPPRALKRLDRAAHALRMYRDGHSIRDIAKVTGYQSPAGAWAAVQKALKLEVRPDAELFRGVELQRLDWLTQVLTKDIRDETDKQKMRRARNVEVLLKVMERRAALMGLDLAESKDAGRATGPSVVVLYERDPSQELRRKEVADVLEGTLLESDTKPAAALPAARLPDPSDGSGDADDRTGGGDGLG